MRNPMAFLRAVSRPMRALTLGGSDATERRGAPAAALATGGRRPSAVALGPIGECGAAAGNFVKTAVELGSPAIGPTPVNPFQIHRVAAPHSRARSGALARRRAIFSLISSTLVLSFSLW